MGLTYAVEYLDTVIRADIPRLSKRDGARIKRAIEQKLSVNPIEFGKPLRYSLKGARSLRVGDFRVVFVIEAPRTVVIVKIGHRREVYGGH